jgi:hypothetical protein
MDELKCRGKKLSKKLGLKLKNWVPKHKKKDRLSVSDFQKKNK